MIRAGVGDPGCVQPHQAGSNRFRRRLMNLRGRFDSCGLGIRLPRGIRAWCVGKTVLLPSLFPAQVASNPEPIRRHPRLLVRHGTPAQYYGHNVSLRAGRALAASPDNTLPIHPRFKSVRTLRYYRTGDCLARLRVSTPAPYHQQITMGCGQAGEMSTARCTEWIKACDGRQRVAPALPDR